MFDFLRRNRFPLTLAILLVVAGGLVVSRGGSRESHGTGAGDVDRRARLDARSQGAVKGGRQDVGQHRQVHDLGQRLVLVRELEQVEVGIGDHDVAGLAADPTAHVDIAVGTARATGVDREAHAGVRLPAVGTVHRRR
jgi:hypothetical protein